MTSPHNRWSIYFYSDGQAPDNSEPAFVGTMDECVVFAEEQGLTRCMFCPFKTADEKLAQERHDHPIPPDEEHCLSREEDAADKKEIKPFDYYEIGTLIIVVILIILFSGSIIWHSIPPFDIKHLLFTHQ